MVFRLGAVALGWLLGMAGLELGLRWLGWGYGNIPFDPDPVLHHVNPRNYRFVSYSPLGEFGGFLVEFDSEGNRRLSQLTAIRPSFRLALLGDSFAAGLEVPAEQSFPGILARQGGGQTEVKTFGVTGYSPVIYDLLWRTKVQRYQPTHVLVLLYCNDTVDDENYAADAVRNAQGEIVAVPSRHSAFFHRLFRHSFLVRLAKKKLAEFHARHERGMAIGGYNEPNRDIEGETQHALLNLKASVRASGARLILSAVPSKAKLFGALPESAPTFEDKVKAWARHHGVEYLDLEPAFQRASREKPLYFSRDIHWNETGHRVAAEEVTSYLSELFPAHPESR